MKILLAFLLMMFAALPARAEKFLDIQEVTSPGGIKAWLVEDHSVPVIALEFAIPESGSARDPIAKQGLARFVASTLDEGAGDLDGTAFQKALTDHSISLSFGASRDNFRGSLRTLTRHRQKAFDLMALALTKPRFDAEAVERMRAANIARVKGSQTDPEWIAARILNDRAYGTHPYALNSGGTISGYGAVTPDDLRAFVRDRLVGGRLVIAVAGDITPGELAGVLDKIFGALPANGAVEPLPAAAVENPGTLALVRRDIPQTVLQGMMPGIPQNDPDYYAAQVMDFILGGSGFGSRLTEEIREKRGLTYGIYTYLADYDHVDVYGFGTSTQNGNAGLMRDLIRKEFERMREAPVSAQELADAQSYLTGAMPLMLSSTKAIAELLMGMQLDKKPLDYLDGHKARIEAVTTADVQRVARRLLDPAAVTWVAVGQPENLKADKIYDVLPHVD